MRGRTAAAVCAAACLALPASAPAHQPNHSGVECQLHGPADHLRVTRNAFDRWQEPSNRSVTRHRHMTKCAYGDKAERRMRGQWHRSRNRWEDRHVYRHLYEWHTTAEEKAWAHSTSSCESDYPSQHDSSGTFHGAFQFMLSTWASSPRSPGGDPHVYPYETQAVVAILLRRRDGAGHWPVCG